VVDVKYLSNLKCSSRPLNFTEKLWVVDVKYLSRTFEEDAIYDKINREWKKVRDEKYEVCEWKMKV
jgi:hypothetical protein